MRYSLSSYAATTLGFRDFEPLTLADPLSCLSGRLPLAAIYADST